MIFLILCNLVYSITVFTGIITDYPNTRYFNLSYIYVDKDLVWFEQIIPLNKYGNYLYSDFDGTHYIFVTISNNFKTYKIYNISKEGELCSGPFITNESITNINQYYLTKELYTSIIFQRKYSFIEINLLLNTSIIIYNTSTLSIRKYSTLIQNDHLLYYSLEDGSDTRIYGFDILNTTNHFELGTLLPEHSNYIMDLFNDDRNLYAVIFDRVDNNQKLIIIDIITHTKAIVIVYPESFYYTSSSLNDDKLYLFMTDFDNNYFVITDLISRTYTIKKINLNGYLPIQIWFNKEI
jgi:hypothetical protein